MCRMPPSRTMKTHSHAMPSRSTGPRRAEEGVGCRCSLHRRLPCHDRKLLFQTSKSFKVSTYAFILIATLIEKTKNNVGHQGFRTLFIDPLQNVPGVLDTSRGLDTLNTVSGRVEQRTCLIMLSLAQHASGVRLSRLPRTI